MKPVTTSNIETESQAIIIPPKDKEAESSFNAILLKEQNSKHLEEILLHCFNRKQNIVASLIKNRKLDIGKTYVDVAKKDNILAIVILLTVFLESGI